jgi:hypothetical protein
MRTTRTAASNLRPATGPTTVSADRRSRARLRDLCDEVLASFRAATNRELISPEDRIVGKQLIGQITGG